MVSPYTEKWGWVTTNNLPGAEWYHKIFTVYNEFNSVWDWLTGKDILAAKGWYMENIRCGNFVKQNETTTKKSSGLGDVRDRMPWERVTWKILFWIKLGNFLLYIYSTTCSPHNPLYYLFIYCFVCVRENMWYVCAHMCVCARVCVCRSLITKVRKQLAGAGSFHPSWCSRDRTHISSLASTDL